MEVEVEHIFVYSSVFDDLMLRRIVIVEHLFELLSDIT